jgi:hypothetical protein
MRSTKTKTSAKTTAKTSTRTTAKTSPKTNSKTNVKTSAKTNTSMNKSTRTSTTMRNSMKTRTQMSVENGIKILQMAINSNLSLSEASRRNSFGRNYLSDVKARIKENYRSKKIDRETYQNFNSLLKTYNSL